jgi:hypothetical protein
MPNLRIVSDNALERAATLTASSTAGTLVAVNLVNWKKSSIHRATATSVAYTATWAAAEPISCVALPFCNLSPTATIRVRAYAANGTTVLYDSGAAGVLACPWPALRPHGFTAAQAASAYAYGGGTYARHWFAQVGAFKLVVDIVDTNNLQGYVEVACMVVGTYWSPKYNASAAPVTLLDSSENFETAGGDTVGEPGFIRREISVDLSYFEADDRTTLMNMARNSSVYPLLLSAFPLDADSSRERDYMIYATRSKSTAIAMRAAAAYTTSITFREV